MKLNSFTSDHDLRGLAQRAARSAASAFDGMTVAESAGNALLSCAVAALSTAAPFELDTGVAVAFPRSPMITATAAWQLAAATEGRFTLGLGTQVRAHIEHRFSAEFDPPVRRMRDYVGALRAIFRAFQGEEALSFRGDYYEFSLLPRTWNPGPLPGIDVPIYLAAVGPAMIRLAAQVADGIHVHPLHSPSYLADVLLPGVRDAATASGRAPGEVRLTVPVFTVVGDTEAERAPSDENTRTQIAFYGATRNYAHQFEVIGRGDLPPRLNALVKAGDADGARRLISDDILEHFAVTATWDELGGKLAERYAGVADRVLMYLTDRTAVADEAAWERWHDVAEDFHAVAGRNHPVPDAAAGRPAETTGATR